jgi:integrase
MGYLYQPKFISGGRSSVWWVKYCVNGRPVRESTKTDNADEARRFLKVREGAAATGAPIPPRLDRVLYDAVAADLVQHYTSSGTRGLVEANCRLKHLNAFFQSQRVSTISPADVTRYVVNRQSQQAANGTSIGRSRCSTGCCGWRTRNGVVGGRGGGAAGHRGDHGHGKLLRLPVIRKLKEAGPRQGFFERDQYDAVRRRLPVDLQVIVDVACTFGWRMQSEVLTLERRQLDLDAGTIRLDPGTTKNDDGRLVYLPAAFKAQLVAQVERVRTLERRLERIVPHLFLHLSGRRQGERIGDFVTRWRTACWKAGIPGRLRHDFRRTEVRDMVNIGVPERVAMTVTGHKTRAVFDRYHIVSPADLQEVARKRDVAGGGRRGFPDSRLLRCGRAECRP